MEGKDVALLLVFGIIAFITVFGFWAITQEQANKKNK